MKLRLGCKLTPIITILFGLSVLAQASSITYFTPPGSTNPVSGRPVDAFATFTPGDGTTEVTLVNLEANPFDVTQNLSDLFFDVGNGGNVHSSREVSGSATEIRIDGSGIITSSNPLTTPAAIGWVLNEKSDIQLELEVLTGPGHAGPSHTIIGPPNTAGIYSNAHGSIAGSPSHNPFIGVMATWEIDAPNVSSDTTITAATFSFGTSAGQNVVGEAVIPEPSSMLLLGSGLLIFAQALRRKLLHSAPRNTTEEGTRQRFSHELSQRHIPLELLLLQVAQTKKWLRRLRWEHARGDAYLSTAAILSHRAAVK